ncbi:MAG TPA: hypothetical protein VIG64_09020, partial [Actinomycetota bacterium]
PEKAGFAPGDTTYRGETLGRGTERHPRPSYRSVAPDDDPAFLAELDERTKRLQRWEDDLKRRDDELRRREEGDE